jgi:hypothetical protein
MDIDTIKLGMWVVDNVGDYCKVLKVGADLKAGVTDDDDAVWGEWSNDTSEILFTYADSVVSMHRTKKQAKAIADIIKASLWQEDY